MSCKTFIRRFDPAPRLQDHSLKNPALRLYGLYANNGGTRPNPNPSPNHEHNTFTLSL
jgi:hypothetical protein